jgi:GH25 family lysozyme M1 (1,4-beta-N-acetylmuramidase)
MTFNLGPTDTSRLQTQLGVAVRFPVDKFTIKALQSRIGTPVDGVFGPASTKRLQKFVGAKADGVWGPLTTAAVKRALDAQKFGLVVPVPPGERVFGIDIAYPQAGHFDWVTVSMHNRFAIIKLAGAEAGIYGPADLADKHLLGVRGRGMRAGFYFFNNGRKSVKDQAAKFSETLRPRIRPGDFVALDIEPSGSATQFTPAQALEFATRIEAVFGVKTFMYINRSTMRSQDWSHVVAAGHPLWLATLDGYADAVKAKTVWWERPSIVQYAVAPSIPGYAGHIDVDYSTIAALDAHAYQG